MLKIDKAFIDSTNEKDLKILEHLVAMANIIGSTTLVEGVEVEEQVNILLAMKCFIIQGFYFDKPLPKIEYEKRIIDPQYK